MDYCRDFKYAIFGLLLLFQYCANGQSWKWEIGETYSHYKFVNSSGNSADFIRPKSGLGLSFSFNSSFLDTASFLGESNKKATYFKQHNLVSKSLQVLKYEVGINMNQFNAVGETQGNTFNYETNFAGINLGIGPEIPLPFGTSLSLQGRFSILKLIHGTQMINGQYFALEKLEMFNSMRVLMGFSAELIKKVNNNVFGFVSFNQMKSLESSQNGEQTLQINPTIISLGIKIKTK